MANWRVRPLAGELRESAFFSFLPFVSPDTSHHVEPKAMRVLVALAVKQGEFVSKEALIEKVWDGRPVTDDVLTGAIHALRAALDDDPRNPRFIETRSNVGYRLLVSVQPDSLSGFTRWVKPVAAACGVLLVLISAALILSKGEAPPKSLTTIAVLPFMNNSESQGSEYLSDAMTEALILNLSRLPDIRVISRTSVLPYAEHKGSAASIAEQLGADLLVEGSVQTADGRMRVVAQLIEPFEDGHLWADNFDRAMGDVLALQHEVSATIASQIGGVLARPSAAVLEPLPAASMENYLQARYLLAQNNIPSGESALKLFKNLEVLHPEFAPAYLGQAQSLLFLFKVRVRNPDALNLALNAGLDYEFLAGADSQSNRCIGQILLLSQWDFMEAENRYLAAIAMDPSDTIALRRHAWLLVALQRYEEAASQIQKIRLLNPLYYESAEMAALLLYSGQIETSVKEYERLDRTTELAASGLRTMAIAYLASGRDDDAREAMVRMLERSGLPDEEQAARYRNASLQDLYRYTLELKPFKSPIISAAFHTLLGNNDAAMEQIQEAVKLHDSFVFFLGALPELAALHDDPRFHALLSQIGVLPENQDHLRGTRLLSATLGNPQADPQEN